MDTDEKPFFLKSEFFMAAPAAIAAFSGVLELPPNASLMQAIVRGAAILSGGFIIGCYCLSRGSAKSGTK